mgnify:FL=1
MNVYIFVVLVLIVNVLLTPNVVIHIPPQDYDWLKPKKYLTKNRLHYSAIIIHSILTILITFALIMASFKKIIKNDIIFENYNAKNYIKNIKFI